MKLGASLLFTIASAQQADNYDYGDYNLDGAAENTDYAPGDSERLRDGKQVDEATGGLDLTMLNSLLSSYGFDYGSSSYDYNYNGAMNADEAITTPAPGTLDPNNFLTTIPTDDAGRPGADGADGKTFENFETDGTQQVATLRSSGRTNCWECNGSGADPFQDCVDNGSNTECLGQGDQDYCMVTIRRMNNVVTQIESRCAQADTCAGIRNFQTDVKGRRNDQCITPDRAGGRNKYKNSVCSVCHFPTLPYVAPYPEDPDAVGAQITDANKSRLHIDSGTQVVGIVSGDDQQYDLIASNDVWEFTNNVLDVYAEE